MKHLITRVAAAVAIVLTTASAIALAADSKAPAGDAGAACATMMQDSAVTPDAKNAMQQFMQSDKAPQMMGRMMEMARKMGDGDVMRGMTKMMDMMSGMGGGTGGGMMGGMMNAPSGSPPTK